MLTEETRRGLALPFDGFRLGFKLRVFNYNLWNALKATGKTRLQIAEELDIPLHTLYQYLSFKLYPKEERKLRIAIYLGVPVDSIFPESITGIRLERQPEPISFTRDEAIALGVVRRDTDPVLEAEKGDLRRAIEAVLETLSGREALVLRLRYGLDDGQSRTLEEVGRELRLTRERIRQIETKALHTLRHPSRSRKLRDFLE